MPHVSGCAEKLSLIKKSIEFSKNSLRLKTVKLKPPKIPIHWVSRPIFLRVFLKTSQANAENLVIHCSRTTRTILPTSFKTHLCFFSELLNSLATDGSHSLLTGTARHGLVRLWDMRDTSAHVAHYYVGHPYLGQSSPVYSVAFDQVWPITKIFSLFPFCVKKIIYLPGGQINDPS